MASTAQSIDHLAKKFTIFLVPIKFFYHIYYFFFYLEYKITQSIGL